MQTTFSAERSKAFEGMIGQSTPHKIVSAVNEGTTLEYGLAATYGTNPDEQVKSLSAITEKISGVLVHEHREEGELLDKEGVSLMRQGEIWVKTEEAVVPGDAVFVRAVAVDPERAGAFRKTADGTDTIDLSAHARWESSAGVGELALLSINLP